MRRVTLAGLRARPGRFVGTFLAVLVATTFLAGALLLRSSISGALRDAAERGLEHVDTAVTANDPTGGANFGGEGLARLPASMEQELRRLPEAAAVAGVLRGRVTLLDGDGKAVQRGITGARWIDDAELNPYRVIEGRAPAGSGDVAVDATTARERGIGVGSEISLGTAVGAQPARVVGLVSYGTQPRSSGNGDVVVDDGDADAWLASGEEQVDSILLRTAPGISPEQLTAAVTAAVGSRAHVTSGDEFRRQQAGDAAIFADALGTGLTFFAYLALFVGAFIIYNTFSISVAQRTHELALLRAIGATGKQVRKAVRLEALLVGAVAGIAGYLLGALLVRLALSVVPALAELAGSSDVALRVGVGSFLLTTVSGTLVTWLSATIPAFRASRVPPVEAMRVVAVDVAGASRRRAIVGMVLLGTGAALLVLGVAIGSAPVGLGGPALLFAGVLVGGPVLASGFVTAVAWLARPFHGVTTTLALANAKRNPKRTATTANALVIGVFLVVFVTAAGGAIRDYAVTQVGRFTGSDVNVFSTNPTGMSEELTDAIAAVPGATQSVAYSGAAGYTMLQGSPLPVGAGNIPEVVRALGLTVEAGSVENLPPDGMVVPSLFSQALPQLALGAPVTVSFASGQTRTYRVAALTSFTIDSPGLLVSDASVAEVMPGLRPNFMAVRAEPGRSDEVYRSIQAVTDSYSSVEVFQGAAFGLAIRDAFDGLISSVNALLAVAVVIAVFGIINTLVLAITERHRELGVLRGVGMTRAQVRGMIRREALVVACLGTLIGIVTGLFVAFFASRPIVEQDGGVFSWPGREVALIAALGIVIGVLASLVPAWRASRLDVLEAIATE